MTHTEHAVGMSLRGNPRWWTLTDPRGTIEVVRYEVPVTRDSAERAALEALGVRADEIIVYVMGRTGFAQWPPLGGMAVFMGPEGIAKLKADGMKVYFYGDGSGAAERLELMLASRPAPMVDPKEGA